MYGYKRDQFQPALLKRFVPAGTLPQGVAARLDRARNILFIDKSVYDSVNERGKAMLWRCQHEVINTAAEVN